MSNAAYAGLRMAARAGKPKPDMEDNMPEDEDEMEADEAESEADSKGKKKEKEYMTESEANAAIAAARAEGFAEANARANTVIGSEHYAGRETLAATMLANDKLSADEIVTMLAAAPKAASPASAEADDDAARADMRQNLAAEQPDPTGQAAEDEAPEAAADTTLVDNMKARYGLK